MGAVDVVGDEGAVELAWGCESKRGEADRLGNPLTGGCVTPFAPELVSRISSAGPSSMGVESRIVGDSAVIVKVNVECFPLGNGAARPDDAAEQDATPTERDPSEVPLVRQALCQVGWIFAAVGARVLRGQGGRDGRRTKRTAATASSG